MTVVQGSLIKGNRGGSVQQMCTIPRLNRYDMAVATLPIVNDYIQAHSSAVLTVIPNYRDPECGHGMHNDWSPLTKPQGWQVPVEIGRIVRE